MRFDAVAGRLCRAQKRIKFASAGCDALHRVDTPRIRGFNHLQQWRLQIPLFQTFGVPQGRMDEAHTHWSGGKLTENTISLALIPYKGFFCE